MRVHLKPGSIVFVECDDHNNPAVTSEIERAIPSGTTCCSTSMGNHTTTTRSTLTENGRKHDRLHAMLCMPHAA